MSVRLAPIAPDDYIREVLPSTYGRWGAGRLFERYTDDFLKTASSRTARSGKQAIGLFEDGILVSSCLRHARRMHWGTCAMRAVIVSAVHTREGDRGRGCATAMLGALLDAEVDAGTDVVNLFSDIAPSFYEHVGFVALPSRTFSVRATSFDGSHAGAVPIAERDWPGVRRAFESLEAARPWGLRRSQTTWAWIRSAWTAAEEPGAGQPVTLVVRADRTVRAYVIGRRIVRRDAFVLDEFGYADERGRALVPAVIRAAAGDLARVSGWLPPEPARSVLVRSAVRARDASVFMVAPVSMLGRAWWKAQAPETFAARGDAVWRADHI